MEFKTQRVAYPYFVVALFLFALQVVMGLWLAVNYAFTLPQELVDVFPFATARAMHTNLLVLWLLLGFMGGTYFMIPDESKTELWSPKLAYAQLILLVGTGVAALIGFFFGWTQGKPLLEIPLPLDFLVVIGALMFLLNVAMTIIKGRNFTMTQGTLMAGLVTLAVLYLFGLPFYKNLSIDWYYWWWVIHLWVEGAWELITAAIFAWLMIKITGVERKVVEKWLYVEIGLFMFTGIAGTGHHYYWIGAPHYWLWVGGIFSALEPVPIILMLWDTAHHVKKRKLTIQSPLIFTLAVGLAIYHFVGAGIWGFAHTLPQINYYTHGSQVTVSHGHLAFFGAYALLNLTVFYYAFSRLKGLTSFREILGKWGFWITSVSMFLMGLAFGVAGVLQSYLERVLGLGFMTTQLQMQLWFKIVLVCGLGFLVGVVILIYDLLTLKPATEVIAREEETAAA
ncbi:MAG: nitric-oxide reductase [Candidatus Zixiibacteriota bacterium]|nr:MAG: nitric-oxide reductase [candidate division Zixibacteria bacterium]